MTCLSNNISQQKCRFNFHNLVYVVQLHKGLVLKYTIQKILRLFFSPNAIDMCI